MTRHTIPQEQTHYKTVVGRQQAISEAAIAYQAALYAFAEGRIPWAELLDRCRQLRVAFRRRRHQAAA